MSGPKTEALPKKTTKESIAAERPCSPAAVCCEKIREAAYYKWEAAGCPDGDGVEYWLQAEAELSAEARQARATARK